MKIRLLYILAFSALSLVACTSKEEVPKAYDEFIINDIKFASNGSKTYWTSEGHFYWDGGDPGLYVNGVPFALRDDAGCWYASRADGDGDVKAVDGYFYSAYYGYGSNNVTLKFLEDQCVYIPEYDPDADWENGVASYVPLAARVSDNNVTLTPCCAILKLHIPSDGALTIYNTDGGSEGTFVRHGNIDPTIARFVDVDAYMETGWIPLVRPRNSEGDVSSEIVYVVLPMEHDEETIGSMEINFDDGRPTVRTMAPSITIRKGYVYNINLVGGNS